MASNTTQPHDKKIVSKLGHNSNLIFHYFITFNFISLEDFATPSLSEENTDSIASDKAETEKREIEQFQLRRSWESR